MNRIEFLILSILTSNNAVGKYSAMSVQEIIKTENLSYRENTFYKQLKVFINHGIVSEGAKEGRALTFYITDFGIKKLKEEKEHEK